MGLMMKGLGVTVEATARMGMRVMNTAVTPGDIGGCRVLGSGLIQIWRGGGEATSCMDGVEKEGTYWTKEVDKIDMWCSCRALNSLRSWVVKLTLLSTHVVVGEA